MNGMILPIDVIGLDWRMPIRKARELGVEKAVQGNLRPFHFISGLVRN